MESEVITPPLDAKSDLNLGALTHVGELEFGIPATGAFEEDLQFFAYTVAVRAGAKISLEIPCTGSRMWLDTTLFVYGPRVTGGSDTLAFDDDSGCRDHARIASLRLPTEGEYVVVVGTASGRGRGHYQLELACKSSSCTPPAPAFACSAFAAVTWDCTVDRVSEGRTEEAPISQGDIDDAFERCTTDAEEVASLRDVVCARIAGDVPGWCESPIPEFLAGPFAPCPGQMPRPSLGDFEWPE